MISKILHCFADMFARLILGHYMGAAKSAVSRFDQGRVCGAISDHVRRNTHIYIPLLIQLVIRLLERNANCTLKISSRDCVAISEAISYALSASFGSWNSRNEAHHTFTHSAIIPLTINWLHAGGMRLSEAMMSDTLELERELNALIQADMAQSRTPRSTPQS